MVETRAITTFGELDALAPAWHKLEQQAPRASVFGSFEWLRAQQLRVVNDRLAIGLAFDGDDLVAALPAVVHSARRAALRFLGRGDRNDILCIPGYEAVAAQVLDEALRVAGPNAVFVGDNVPSDSPFVRLVGEGAGGRGRQWVRPAEHVVSVQTDYDEYLAATHGSRSRQALRRKLRWLRQAGTLRLVEVPREDLPSFLEIGGRFKFSNLRGVYNTSHLCRAAARAMLKAFVDLGGQVRAWDLQLDGCTVAGTVDLVHGHAEWYFLPFMNPDFYAWSPGNSLLHLLIPQLADRGVAELNFGHGDEPYKQRWSTSEQPLLKVALASPGRSLSSLVVFGETARERLRRSGRLQRLCSWAQAVTLRRERHAVEATGGRVGIAPLVKRYLIEKGWRRGFGDGWRAFRRRTVGRERRLFWAMPTQGTKAPSTPGSVAIECLPAGRYRELDDLLPGRQPSSLLDRWRQGWVCYVVRWDGRPVNVAWVKFKAPSPLNHCLVPPPNTAYVFGDYTAPTYRGRGIAGMTKLAIAADAAQQGKQRVLIAIDAWNDAAIRAAQKTGFRLVAEVTTRWRFGRSTAVDATIHDDAFGLEEFAGE